MPAITMKLCSYISSHCCGYPPPEFFGNTAEKEADESSEEGSDYEDEGEEDIDLEDFEEADEADLLAESDADEPDDEEEEEEEEETMPPKKKAAPKKATRSPARKKASSVEDLNAGVEGMSLTKDKYSMNGTYPFILSSHFDDRREFCRVDFFVPTLPTSSFKVKVSEDKLKLLVYTVIPLKFVSEVRLDQTNTDDAEFNASTHENTAYKKIARTIKKDHQDERNPQLTVIGEPQIIDLPFPCEDEVEHNVEYHSNRAMAAVIQNHRQFMAVLAVHLTSVEKPQDDVRGGFRIVESEDDGGEEEQEEIDEMA